MENEPIQQLGSGIHTLTQDTAHTAGYSVKHPGRPKQENTVTLNLLTGAQVKLQSHTNGTYIAEVELRPEETAEVTSNNESSNKSYKPGEKVRFPVSESDAIASSLKPNNPPAERTTAEITALQKADQNLMLSVMQGNVDRANNDRD